MTDIEGIDTLMKKLQSLGGEVDKGVERGLLLAAKTIQADAKLRAPVGDTGQLRNMITASVTTVNGKKVGLVHSGAKYSAFVEFGTGPRGEASKPSYMQGLRYKQEGWAYHDGEKFVYTNGQAAQPFLYPAFALHKPKIDDYIKVGIKQEITKLMLLK